MDKHQIIKNRYIILGKVGQGGMGVVYHAKDRITGDIVALKQVLVETEHSTFAAQSFEQNKYLALMREFKTLASLRHPHIISVFDYGLDENEIPFFTMEMLDDAQPLQAVTAQQSFREQVSRFIEILYALSYLHQHDVVHGDLKPSNILITSDGRLKLLDFGLAVKNSHPVSLPGGTLAYMSPERLNNYAVTPASDLYTFGIILYETISGEYPYKTDDVIQLIQRITTSVPSYAPLTRVLPASAAAQMTSILSRLIARDPQARYQSIPQLIDDLTAAAGLAQQADAIRIRESAITVKTAKFVGREAELQRLTGVISRLTERQGSSWLVGGESGVGKSRFITEIRIHALVAGMDVFQGQGVEGGGLPYQLWWDMIPHLVVAVEPTDLEACVLQCLVPDLGALLNRDLPDAPDLSAEQTLNQFASVIANLLRRMPRPFLVILEDLQWGGESLRLLQKLQAMPDLPGMFLGSYRSDEAADLPEKLPGMEVIHLGRLNKQAVSELSKAIMGPPGSDAKFVARLMRETDGNTFFLVESLRVLAEEAGGLYQVTPQTFPKRIFTDNMRQLIQRKLSFIPAELHRPLYLAAVLGREIELSIMNEDMTQCLAKCATIGFIEPVGTGWQFAHDKFREGLMEMLSEEQYREFNRWAAEILEASYGEAPPYFERILRHWRASKQPEKQIHYALLLGHNLDKLPYNFILIARYLQEALALMDVVGSSPKDKVLLLKYLGDVERRTGHLEAAMTDYESSLKQARQTGDAELIIRGIIGLSRIKGEANRIPEAIVLADEALDLARQEENELILLSALLSRALMADLSGDHTRIEDYARSALIIAEQTHSHYEIASSCDMIGTALFQAGRFQDALVYREKAVGILRELGNPSHLANALYNLAGLKAEVGDLEGAEANIREALRMAEQ
ncbi:MAG: protein kinase, partial [Anaerolineae bacterium]|nr:protein kinase [Anaerolineae bacterium]